MGAVIVGGVGGKSCGRPNPMKGLRMRNKEEKLDWHLLLVATSRGQLLRLRNGAFNPHVSEVSKFSQIPMSPELKPCKLGKTP